MSLILPPAPPPLVVPDLSGDIGKYIATYVKLRDASNEMKKRHTAERKPLLDALEMLETGFLKALNTSGSDSIKANGVGTVYRTVKRRATIEDGDLFRRHVIGAEDWDIVDWRANATEIHKHMTENGQDVPGVKYSEDAEVGIRRA